ncbi:dihydrofolate reductase [bacterium]|nr:dihydrofolate reductase [bacterium]
MRKVIMFNMISLDGLFETLDHRIDWTNHDPEFDQFTVENAQSSSAGSFIFGRATYEMMSSFWPTPAAMQNNPIIAKRMNEAEKYVFSRSLSRVDWQNSILVKGDAVEELQRIKREPGKDLVIFGSGDLSANFIKANLIDQFQFVVNPILLGSGTPLFKHLPAPVKLKHLSTRTFTNGNVFLTYELIK